MVRYCFGEGIIQFALAKLELSRRIPSRLANRVRRHLLPGVFEVFVRLRRARIASTSPASLADVGPDRTTVQKSPRARGRPDFRRSVAVPNQLTGEVDTALQLRIWIDRYQDTGRPIKVNFREAVPWIRVGDRATHYIHPYPAKLLPQIAYFFAHASTLSKPGDTILDPFAGTGTVGLEALLAGRNAVLFDANPLATLIATVKTQRVSTRRLTAGIRRLEPRLRSRCLASLPSVVNLDHWFERKTVRALRQVLHAVESEKSVAVRHFLLVCFSVLVRKVSLCDPRLTVPVRLKARKNKRKMGGATHRQHREHRSVKAIFREIVGQNLERAKEFEKFCHADVTARIIRGDARKIVDNARTGDLQVSPESAQLIISSPPYGGAQKYVRASSLSLGWLRLAHADELRALEEKTIGREHFHKAKYAKFRATRIASADSVLRRIAQRDPLRACISGTYLREMRAACQQMMKALRPGGYLVLVIGNNLVARIPFLTSRYMAQILQECGFELQLRLVDDIKSRGLMTKRNTTASVISREWVLLFRKPMKEANV